MLIYEVLKIETSANYLDCCFRPHKNSSATHVGVAAHQLGTTFLVWFAVSPHDDFCRTSPERDLFVGPIRFHMVYG